MIGTKGSKSHIRLIFLLTSCMLLSIFALTSCSNKRTQETSDDKPTEVGSEIVTPTQQQAQENGEATKPATTVTTKVSPTERV